MSTEICGIKLFIRGKLDGDEIIFNYSRSNDFSDVDDGIGSIITSLGKVKNYRNEIGYYSYFEDVAHPTPKIFFDRLPHNLEFFDEIHPDYDNFANKFNNDINELLKKICKTKKDEYFECTFPAWEAQGYDLSICEILNKNNNN